jgi:hypothetical protein
MWINGKSIADCTNNGMGPATALTDGVDTAGGVYVEVDACTNASAGFTTWK